MSGWLQKSWGWTRCLYEDETFEFWDAHCLAGGYSSRHWHDAKENLIYARTAVLRCTIYGATERTVWIAPRQAVTFPRGVEHRFEVMQSGTIYETYWGDCNPQDIVRRDSNGWRPPLA